ncbi:unnamed protein product, partial [Urochloa humidicola]
EIRRCQLLRVHKEEEQLVSGRGEAGVAATDALQAGGVSRNIMQITSCEIKGRRRTNHGVRPG